ncbi:hypothetical protein HWV62_35650 [Athelia sp. TMB]|nr:hypothetical protein HWV62_35650 [Athelia sp. TMB]
MSISRASLRAIPTSYATCSIGAPSDPLPSKLAAISAAGFKSIELSFPDLLAHAELLSKSSSKSNSVREDDYDTLCGAAEDVKRICGELGLGICMLQPFARFEGWREGTKEREEAWDRARGWVKIMQACGTDMLQVGSSDAPAAPDSSGITTAAPALAADLRALADLLAPHGLRIAYENWCWSTHAPAWHDAWALVRAADRPNVGLCLDTFQAAGAEWADPTQPDGRLLDADARWAASLTRLAREVPAEKIFILQISDAYRPVPAMGATDEGGLRPRGRWSHAYRPLPFRGGYLPVVAFSRAVLQTGFKGLFSVEVFDGGPDGGDQKGKDEDGLKEEAEGAMQAHVRLLDECADAA